MLTPNGGWHDHAYRGDAPMIWLDVLGISLVRSMHATLFEGSPEPRQPTDAIPDCSFRAVSGGVMRPLNERRVDWRAPSTAPRGGCSMGASGFRSQTPQADGHPAGVRPEGEYACRPAAA